MKIDRKLLNEWKKLRSEGDLTTIAAIARSKGGRLTKTAPSTVSDAFTKGHCRAELFKVISEFYKERKAMVTEAAKAMEEAA